MVNVHGYTYTHAHTHMHMHTHTHTHTHMHTHTHPTCCPCWSTGLTSQSNHLKDTYGPVWSPAGVCTCQSMPSSRMTAHFATNAPNMLPLISLDVQLYFIKQNLYFPGVSLRQKSCGGRDWSHGILTKKNSFSPNTCQHLLKNQKMRSKQYLITSLWSPELRGQSAIYRQLLALDRRLHNFADRVWELQFTVLVLIAIKKFTKKGIFFHPATINLLLISKINT